MDRLMIGIYDDKTSSGFDLHSPANAPSNATIMGAFGNRLFEHNALLGEFPIDAHDGE